MGGRGLGVVLALGIGCTSAHVAPDLDASAVDAAALDTAALDAGQDAGPSSPCPAGSLCTLAGGGAGACCREACVDVARDAAHCARCDAACAAGMICAAGACTYDACALAVRASDAPCTTPDGTLGQCCGGACHAPADFASDDANCGGCELVCPIGETCTTSACMHDGPACGAGLGGACPTGYVCVGARACALASCTGASDGSSCARDASTLGTCCGGACVDVDVDRASCGVCGHACASGSACIAGVCVALPDCSGPGASGGACLLPGDRAGVCCGTTCTDPSADPTNCGACGRVCGLGASCVAMGASGACGTSTPGGGFSASICTAPADCPAGIDCYTGGASIGFCARLRCDAVPDGGGCYLPGSPWPGLCCGGACVDPTRDPNCGACGNACPSGVCVTLPELEPVTCLPDGTTAADCARFGCPAGDECIGGVCMSPSCTSYGSFCALANGHAGVCCASSPGGTPSCIDVASDAASCGACNTPCVAGQTCSRGRCG